MSLSELFPEGDYRFQMALRRGAMADFFGHSPANSPLLAERKRWLKTDARSHAACLPEGVGLLNECVSLAHELEALSAEQHAELLALPEPEGRCAALGQLWEPDFLLLKSDASGPLRLLAGCVCFPSSWSLAEKIGKPLETIHGAVPSLNSQIGSPIESFLSRLVPGVTWLRHNWGLSRSPDLNQHPLRHLPRLDDTVQLSEVWLRVEHQALARLSQSNGVLFGLRIAMHPLAEVKEEPDAAGRLARALQTMPAEITAYKGLATARHRIISLLQ